MRRLALVCLLLLGCTTDGSKGSSEDVQGGDDGGSGDGEGEDGGSGDDGGDDGGDEGGDDGGDEAWRDDPRLTDADSLPADLLAIVGPNWGGDLAVDGDRVTVVGTVAERVVELSWSNGTDSGSVPVASAWTAADLVLTPGDNQLVFTATDADGNSESEAIVVSSTPGVPLASGLSVSLGQVDVGTSVEVVASVLTDGTVSGIEVGPDDGAGGLSEVWGTLSDPDEDGRWAGILSVPVESASAWTLRAVAEVDGRTGATPTVDFTVSEPLSDDAFEALDRTMAAVDAAMDAAADDAVSRAEAAAQALLGISEVEAVLLHPSGRTVEYIQSGLPHVIYQPLDGELGAEEVDFGALPTGELPAASPPPSVPSMSPVRHLRAQTWSSAGTAGPPPPPSTATDSGEIISLAPFSDHFVGHYDADGDGTTDRSFPIEVGEFLPELIRARTISCPAVGEPVRYGITDPAEVDLSAVRDALNAGIFALSTHGMLSRWYGPSGWGAERGILATRQGPARRDLSAEDQAMFNAGHLVRVKARGEWVLAFTGEWIRAERPADFPMQNTVVALAACNSGANVEPIASFMAAGASVAYGYDDGVSAGGALNTDVAFMRGFLDREEANSRLSEVSAHFPGDGSRLVWLSEDDVYLGDPTGLRNGGFEDLTPPNADPDHWTTVSALGTDFDAFRVTEYLSTVPEEGSHLLYMFTYDGDPSYNEVGQDICPAPNRLMRLSFKWQVRTNEWSSCGASGVPNWLNVRMQGDDFDATVLWHVDWSDVCPMLYDTGEHSQKSTGWQEAEVFFEAPDTRFPDDERLVFTVGGYNASIWLGFLDDVQLVPVD